VDLRGPQLSARRGSGGSCRLSVFFPEFKLEQCAFHAIAFVAEQRFEFAVYAVAFIAFVSVSVFFAIVFAIVLPVELPVELAVIVAFYLTAFVLFVAFFGEFVVSGFTVCLAGFSKLTKLEPDGGEWHAQRLGRLAGFKCRQRLGIY
jgi:hypothetical protein